MATKKAASTKKATASKPVVAKTTVRTVSADEPVKHDAPVRVSATDKKSSATLPSNIVHIVLAEIIGTFILTAVALATLQETGALYVGITVALLVMAIGAISGSHLNPAVTFGLFTMRRLKAILLPFYWGAQFLGAMFAVFVINGISGNAITLNFGHLGNMNWSIFGIELVAAAVFMFGLAAAISRRDLSAPARAVGVGVALMVAIIVGGTLLTATRGTAIANYQKQMQSSQQTDPNKKPGNEPAIPAVAYVKGVTINPAVALATTDRTKSELTTGAPDNKETTYSRLSLEVIFGTLLGAAIGGNLYLLLAGRKND